MTDSHSYPGTTDDLLEKLAGWPITSSVAQQAIDEITRLRALAQAPAYPEGVERLLTKIADLVDAEDAYEPLDDAIRWANEALAIIRTGGDAQAGKEPTASELIAWFKTRPGISWEMTVRDIERAISALSSTKRLCPNGLDHGNCGFPDCVSSCPGRLSLSSTTRATLPGYDETMANLNALTIRSKPRCTCAVIVNPNIPHARSCPLSSPHQEAGK